MLSQKIKKIQSVLKERNVDAVMVAPSEEMGYIFGINPHLCERFHGLVITRDNGCFDVCNILSKDEMIKGLGDEIPVYCWRDGESFAECFKAACQAHHLTGKKIGINQTVRAFNLMAIQNMLDVEFVDGRDIIRELRIIKKEDELNKLAASAQLADSVFERVLTYIKPGLTEADITTFVDKAMRQGGASDTFVLACAGENSAYPHYNQNDGVIKSRDMLLLDWGCKLNGYWSDITRTVFIGDISDEQKNVYNIVKTAQQKAIDAVRIGLKAGEVDAIARRHITDCGYGDYFTTRLGHGIGSSVHEGPFIVANNAKELRKNMCFTIEPGIYLTGAFGIRIEDSLTVNEHGASLFNKLTKDLIIL